LQEDEKIQQLDQKEGNINTAVQDLKYRHKNMAILYRMKVCTRDEEPADRVEVNLDGEAVKEGLVGAIIGRRKNNDYRVGRNKGHDREVTLGKYRSVEGAHDYVVGRKYCRKECVGKKQVQELTGRFQALKKSLQEANTA
jgi:hypothetical protein